MSASCGVVARHFSRIPSPPLGLFGYRTLTDRAEVDAARLRRTKHSSRDLRQRDLRRMFKKSNRLFARHTRKVIKKYLEAVSAFDVIEKRANRHSSSDEDGIPAVNLRVKVDNRSKIIHVVARYKDTPAAVEAQL